MAQCYLCLREIQTDQDPFTCPHCKETQSQRAAAMREQAEHSRAHRLQYKCEECGVYFEKTQPTGKLDFPPCPSCGGESSFQEKSRVDIEPLYRL